MGKRVVLGHNLAARYNGDLAPDSRFLEVGGLRLRDAELATLFQEAMGREAVLRLLGTPEEGDRKSAVEASLTSIVKHLDRRVEKLERDRRQDAHQIDWLSTRLSVLEGTTGQRLAALEGQAAARAAGECECHDILRLIRHKLEEKRAGEQQSSQMAGGFRAVAYREAIALIDEALTKIEEETDD